MSALFKVVLVTVAFSSCLLSAHAENRIKMQGTAIVGNQELPKVLYIVPWKTPELPDMANPPLQSLIDEALSPIEREVFRREVFYYDALSVQQGHK